MQPIMDANAVAPRLLPKSSLDDLLQLLQHDGYEIVGPRRDQGALIYAPIQSASDLPMGWGEEQTPGSYRLTQRGDNIYFGFAVGPHSWKKYLFPPRLQLWSVQRVGNTFTMVDSTPDPPRRALLGMRACELHALAIQDRVFIRGAGGATDPLYANQRQRLFLVAVECEYPGGNCFCTSMGTGPAIADGRTPLPLVNHGAANENENADGPAVLHYDLALTELDDAFILRPGSAAGLEVLNRLQLAAAAPEQVNEARQRVEAARHKMGKNVDITDIQGLLQGNQEHPRWTEVADRCLACTNCTMVCPTCFCSRIEETSDLNMETAQRVRSWDSCFSPEFGQVVGGNFRSSIRGRYRQWLTHKFASWHDQFDLSGCVGCGRCITWCPVGIDVTEEITAIRDSDGRPKEGS
jgi:ferredoxin